MFIKPTLLNVLMNDTLIPISDALPFSDHVANKHLVIEWGQVFASWLLMVMSVNRYNARHA